MTRTLKTILSILAVCGLLYCVKCLNEPHEWNETQAHKDSLLWVKSVDSARVQDSTHKADSLWADSIVSHEFILHDNAVFNLITSDTKHTSSWLIGGDLGKETLTK